MYYFRESKSANPLLPSFTIWGPLLKKRVCSPVSIIFFLSGMNSSWKGIVLQGSKREVGKSRKCLLCTIGGKRKCTNTTEQLKRNIWPRGYKTFFMLNSVEHEILNAHKYENIKKFNNFQAQISLECYFSCS